MGVLKKTRGAQANIPLPSSSLHLFPSTGCWLSGCVSEAISSQHSPFSIDCNQVCFNYVLSIAQGLCLLFPGMCHNQGVSYSSTTMLQKSEQDLESLLCDTLQNQGDISPPTLQPVPASMDASSSWEHLPGEVVSLDLRVIHNISQAHAEPNQ